MEEAAKNLKYVFEAKSIALVGASENPDKLGNVILKNLVDGGYRGKIFPVNPKHKEILSHKCYPDIRSIPGKVECAIVATPAQTVLQIVADCAKKGIKGVVVLSGGFGEMGNVELEKKLADTCRKAGIALIGPNCLGVINPETRIDSIFMPFYKFKRPSQGGISFITQSGGVGSAVIDLAASYGIGIAKFVSYGNGALLSEADLIEYLADDARTKTIILYIEGAKDGRRMFQALKRASLKKPVVALKAGRGGKAGEAARSHTGNIAGEYLAYHAAFRQARVIEADGIGELFDFVRVFSQGMPKNGSIGVITNGGGIGVLAADAIEREGLELAQITEADKKAIAKWLPEYAHAANPLDIIADADITRFEKAIEAFMGNPEIGALVICVLFQLPSLDERLIKALVKASDDKRKPIAVVAMGGDYTLAQRKMLEAEGVPTYRDPVPAVRALKRLYEYAKFRNGKKKK
jgi:acetate---CoA ligase (ADP-forming)